MVVLESISPFLLCDVGGGIFIRFFDDKRQDRGEICWRIYLVVQAGTGHDGISRLMITQD